MFRLVELLDIVRVPCLKFNFCLETAVAEELNNKLANKVIPNVGLCICLHEIIKLEEPYIVPSDEASHARITFRMVVFRPCKDEIIVGQVKCNSPSGIQVTLEFFDAIFIKAADLQDGMFYDSTDNMWYWTVNDNNLPVDVGAKFVLRVKGDSFQDTTPTGPQLAAENKAQLDDAEKRKKTNVIKDTVLEIHPYTIYGTIYSTGLGLKSWWENCFDEDEEQGVMEEEAQS